MPNPIRQDIHVNRPLTNISVAYIQKATSFVAGQVFPIVPVKKQSDRYFVYLKEDWFRDEAMKRVQGLNLLVEVMRLIIPQIISVRLGIIIRT